MRIGICGPFNPNYILDYLNDKNVPTINSGASAVNLYVRALINAGHIVTIFTTAVPGGSEDLVFQGKNVTVFVVHSAPGYYVTHALSRYYMIERIKTIIRKHVDEIDVLHAQWSYDFAYAAMSFSSVVPVFCTVRDWAPRILSMQKGVKKIQWWFYSLLSKKVIQNHRIHLIANSPYIKECLEKTGVERDITLIGNPIDEELIIERKKNEVVPYTYISIANGAGSPWKNITRLLQAFQIVRQQNSSCILKLAGDGFYEDSPFIRSVEQQGLLKGVKLLGQLSRLELIKEIDESSCLVHPSLEESFGNIFLEGMARCVPVIGGLRSGAVPALLGHGEYGFLCDMTKSEDIAELMLKVANDSNILDTTLKATRYLQENYLDTIVIKKHLLLYQKYTNSL